MGLMSPSSPWGERGERQQATLWGLDTLGAHPVPQKRGCPQAGTRLPLVPRSCHLLPRRHFESIWGCSHLSSWPAAHPKAHPAALLAALPCGPVRGTGRKALLGCWPGCPTPLVPGLPSANVVCSPHYWPTLCAWPTLCVQPEQSSGFFFFSL